MRHRLPGTLLLLLCAPAAFAQPLDVRLKSEDPAVIAADAQARGDARRGAVLFHLGTVGCIRCHKLPGSEFGVAVGPDLSTLAKRDRKSDLDLIESVLWPSKHIRQEFQTVVVVTAEGEVHSGLRAEAGGDGVALRNPLTGAVTQFASGNVEEVATSKTSLMPAGLANGLKSRDDFLHLVAYLSAVRDGGAKRAAELTPSPSQLRLPLPEYENRVDHAGLIAEFGPEMYAAGEQIYSRVCANCHGTGDRVGSLPTALRFSSGKFRQGSDPFAMYQTVTHGFGLMLPQTWMVPRQKYAVIHYIREAYLKPHNPRQLRPVTQAYLDSLPKGDTKGPEPTEFAPWSDMDYGPWMFGTVEVGTGGKNFAYKGFSARLDDGTGGVSKGRQWMVFDHDTLRVAAGWSATEGDDARFINWQGIHFDGRHGAHPRVSGNVAFAVPNGPGWANPQTGSFDDSARVTGRDDKRYGPLPRDWARFRGLHRVGETQVLRYEVGGTPVLERLGGLDGNTKAEPTFIRTLRVGPTRTPLTLALAASDGESASLEALSDSLVRFGSGSADESKPETKSDGTFDGSRRLESQPLPNFDTRDDDFSIHALIRTKSDGVIVAKALPGPKWTPDGVVLFINGGRLCYDIGWVGVVRGKHAPLTDGKWHRVGMTYEADSETVRLFVDGREVAEGELSPERMLKKAVLRVGYGAPNFPRRSPFTGSIRDLTVHQRLLSDAELRTGDVSEEDLLVRALSGKKSVGPQLASVAQSAGTKSSSSSRPLLAGVTGGTKGVRFHLAEGHLCLTLSASDKPREFSVWLKATGDAAPNTAPTPKTVAAGIALSERVSQEPALPTAEELATGVATDLWPEVLTTTVTPGTYNADGFAVDALAAPSPNPWLARLRFSGHDFFSGGDRLAVCTWDGDVYIVSGLRALRTAAESDPVATCELKWKRIASGLFQPLGLKIVDDVIHLSCRDQIVILRDKNFDGAVDVYECFNNDHQVTEHFHEFAMGLQRDTAGNFYYAKSARHAKTALVPHHGTLLRVTPDGEQTDILAVGFRAANGVCLNPDGTFIVTDQEGHWNPKNRINWVAGRGGFYGNIYGYHDVTDTSDEAMRPPLCWITNAFDRSPAELLWVPEDAWGPLGGRLLNLSYGYGKVYVVPHEHIGSDNQVQGGMCVLPFDQFPTGTMRGRFSPDDSALYVCGLFAWGSSQQRAEGGLFRVRYRGDEATVPVKVNATEQTLTVTFTDALDRDSITKAGTTTLRVWGLKRTKNYGSKHIDEHEIDITSASLSADGKTLTLTVPDLAPTWCYALTIDAKTASGRRVTRELHGTIHRLGSRTEQ